MISIFNINTKPEITIIIKLKSALELGQLPMPDADTADTEVQLE